MERQGRKRQGKETKLTVSFPLPSFIQWSACWVLPSRSGPKTAEATIKANVLVLELLTAILQIWKLKTKSSNGSVNGLFSPCCCSYCLCPLDENMSLNCSQQPVYRSSSRWYMIIYSHGEMMLTGKNQRSPKRNLSLCHIVHHTSHMDWAGPPEYVAEVLTTRPRGSVPFIDIKVTSIKHLSL
jgi:hypothetical protein